MATIGIFDSGLGGLSVYREIRRLLPRERLIYFGDSGLRVLSVIVGVTDINPFIINLFQTQHAVAGSLLILATFQAMISNSFVNMIYGVAFSGKKLLKDLALGASVICAVNILILVIFL